MSRKKYFNRVLLSVVTCNLRLFFTIGVTRRGGGCGVPSARDWQIHSVKGCLLGEL